MSWFVSGFDYVNDRGHASTIEILRCFLDEKQFLHQLAFLTTGDSTIADQSVVNACEMTLKGHSPFRDWLLEWAKAVTITTAISNCAESIRDCEAKYKDQVCVHVEHTCQIDPPQRAAYLNVLLQVDAPKVITELDALSRAVLVLRLAVRSSIQDCVVRLNVGRSAVIAANCRAMAWLCELHTHAVAGEQHGSSTRDVDFHSQASPEPGGDQSPVHDQLTFAVAGGTEA